MAKFSREKKEVLVLVISHHVLYAANGMSAMHRFSARVIYISVLDLDIALYVHAACVTYRELIR